MTGLELTVLVAVVFLFAVVVLGICGVIAVVVRTRNGKIGKIEAWMMT